MSIQALADKKIYVDGFIESYKKWYAEHDNRYLDIENDDLIFYFVNEKAYADMQLRTLWKLKANSSVAIDKKQRVEVMKWVSSEIKKYIVFGLEDNTNFDTWHKNICRQILELFNENLLKDKYQPMDYGKAQKLVNVTLKYLATCHNAEKYESRFSDCHMVLDRYILDWYYEVVCPVKKSYRKAWSSLTESEYFEIQENIKNYLALYNKKPFVEEWSIFEEYKK